MTECEKCGQDPCVCASEGGEEEKPEETTEETAEETTEEKPEETTEE